VFPLGHHRFMAGAQNRIENARVISCDDRARDVPRPQCALNDMHDHRLIANF
jgi:hypothetical protein